MAKKPIPLYPIDAMNPGVAYFASLGMTMKDVVLTTAWLVAEMKWRREA